MRILIPGLEFGDEHLTGVPVPVEIEHPHIFGAQFLAQLERNIGGSLLGRHGCQLLGITVALLVEMLGELGYQLVGGDFLRAGGGGRDGHQQKEGESFHFT